ncbi:MAG: TolC family protein [Tannerellaceae bacterium]|jgi:outer membrane protein TolC|nr:TolC family protein [Tannerellaceae bacterium]
MKPTVIILLLLSSLPAINTPAQVEKPATGIRDVLQSIAVNNKELRMNDYQSLIVRSQYAAMNALPDPAVSYTRQYGNKEGLGINGELIASQAFDFPTLYIERDKLSRSKSQSLDLRQAELRRQILLNAQEICLDLIMLRQEQALLEQRLANAGQLDDMYAKRLEKGDATRLETNKIRLELLNVKTEVKRNAIAEEDKLKELTALNGGIPVAFDSKDYEQLQAPVSFEELCNEASSVDPGLRALRSEQSVARQALRVSRAGWLPQLELGYQLNTVTGGERFNGFLVGLSIPVFSNRQKVRQARAETIYSELRYDDAAIRNENELRQLYRRSAALEESMSEYKQLLEGQNNLSLANKALESGRISMIEYFVEVASFYDSLQNYIRLENDYQKTSARMLKHRL